MIDTIKIKQQMILKDITVVELSKRLNVNVNTISRWINNKHLDSINTFLDMLLILELDIKDIK